MGSSSCRLGFVRKVSVFAGRHNLIKFYLLIKNFFFPGVCALCGGSLIRSEEIRYSLCDPCRRRITPDNDDDKGSRCGICGKPLISEIDTCLPCRDTEKGDGAVQRSYDRLWVLYPYNGKYRNLLTKYKFEKNVSLANFFSEKVMEVITGEPSLREAVIVPVPPRPGKIKTNGWDQVDYLVKKIQRISGEQTVSYCLKRRKSKTQKFLNRKERIENLKDRIYLKKSAPKVAVIIDDVITTGSTMEICASVLKEGGAEKVYGLCLMYD